MSEMPPPSPSNPPAAPGSAPPGEPSLPPGKFFLPYQSAWIADRSPLKIVEKGRQIGLSYADSYDSVIKAGKKRANGARDVWVMSRDEIQAKQYILYCKYWAGIVKRAARALFDQPWMMENGKAVNVQKISFASGCTIYALSSNPDAIVGKTGHVKLDEFAVSKAQRELFALAKPVTQWGGTLSVISTHRGILTEFNKLIRDIRERGNPMGWSLHTIPIQRAVDEGIVEKINKARNTHETRAEFLARLRRECIDEEQWLQEYCCAPADESSAFITYAMIAACEDDSARRPFEYLLACKDPLYLGADIARTRHLTVFDVEEKIGDVFWERHRIELQDKSFDEQEQVLYRLLALPQLRRACIDATGLGMQLAERARKRFGPARVEAVRFTSLVKEDLSFPLRSAHENRTLRYTRDQQLQADLRGIKKEMTASGNIRFVGESDDSHCDRFWAKALALHAGKDVCAVVRIIPAGGVRARILAARQAGGLNG